MDKYMPLVSVVIPTYNRGSVIAAAVESALNQTYKKIEVIVVDDGSRDNTKESLRPYGDRINYIYKENGGCSSARNKGMKAANGKYIAFLDSDDLWYPEKLEKQMEALLEKADYGMAISDINFLDKDSRHLSFSNLRKTVLKDGYILNYLLKMPHMTCSYMVVKKKVFDEVGVFDEAFRTANDFDMMLRICAKFKTLLVEEPLVKYKKSDNSVSHQVFTGSRLKAIEKFKQYNPDLASRHKRLIASTEARIHLSYAEDLLWNRYLKEARRQISASCRNRCTVKAVSLYIKAIIMDLISLVAPKYKDKGTFKISKT